MCKHADLLRVEANEGEFQCENRFLSLSLSVFFQHLSNDFVQVDDIRSLSFSLQLLFCFGFFSLNINFICSYGSSIQMKQFYKDNHYYFTSRCWITNGMGLQQ